MIFDSALPKGLEQITMRDNDTRLSSDIQVNNPPARHRETLPVGPSLQQSLCLLSSRLCLCGS